MYLLLNVNSDPYKGHFNCFRSTTSNWAYQYYYFPPLILANEELYLYTVLTMVAEVGGYIGLLLGVSFLQLAEVGATITRNIGARIYEVQQEEEEGGGGGRNKQR